MDQPAPNFTPPRPEVITGDGMFRAGLGAIVSEWQHSEAAAVEQYDRLWLEANATNLDEDVPFEEGQLTLEEAVSVIHDGIELLDCVDSIYFESDTGKMRVETDTGTFNVLVSLDADVTADDPAAALERLTDAHGGHWGAHPDFPPADWRHEAENNETRLGYWEWVADRVSQKEAEDAVDTPSAVAA